MNQWIKVGHVEDIPRQGARVVKTDALGDIAIFRTLAENIYALSNKCPHKGGPLSEGIVHGEKITCPLHNMTFDLASGAATGPDDLCAGHFPVKVEEGEIFISLVLEYA